MEIKLRGIPVSPGVSIGPAVTYHVQDIEPPRYLIIDPIAELQRFDEAVERVRESLKRLKLQTAEELGEQHAAIFDSHVEILDDVALRPEIERRLAEERLNVEYLVDDIINGFAKILSQVDDPHFRGRSTDFVDVGRRILGALLNRELESLKHLEIPCIVIAHDLTPSETVDMDMSNTMGIVTDEGGPTSHMSILARAFEIPCVVGLRYAASQAAPGDTVIVDGVHGDVIIRPTEATLKKYEAEKERQDEQSRRLVQAESKGPRVTLDGVEIPTYANIELLAETEHSKRANCQGIGLYRTEYLFMNRAALPTEEEQYESYTSVVASMSPLPVTMRTLDLGGDKVVEQLGAERETNPQLGWRSIRLCLDRPDIFKAQLRALLRASAHGNLDIMFPMISGLDQLREAKAIVQEVKDDLRLRGIAFNEDVKVGSMIEVPAAVAVAKDLAAECDFFSIGSNDLIQYCLAVDRVNPRTAYLYEPLHPGVLRHLKQTIDAADKAGIPCSICGEMAGDPVLTELLLGLGFRSLSMSAVSLPMVRAEIANTKLTKAKRFARKVLNTGSSSEIKRLLAQRHKSRSTMKLYRGQAVS